MRPLLAALVAVLLLAAPVMAATQTFTGTARPTRSFAVVFTTSSAGDLEVSVDVSKPKSATYFFEVRDQTHDVIYCKAVYSADTTCLIPNAPAANWEATLFPTSGKLGITLEVTIP